MGKNQILAAFLAAVMALSCISFPAAAADTPDHADNAITLGFQIQDADNGKNGWYINPDMNNQDEIAVDLIMTGNQNQIDFFTAQLYIQYDPAVLNFNFSDGAESKIIASQSRNNINYLTLTASNPKSGVIQLTYTPFSASLQTPNAKVTGGAAFTTLYFTLADANDSSARSTSLSYQTPANLPSADMMVIRNIPANPVPETRYDLQYASVHILMPGASNPANPTSAPKKSHGYSGQYADAGAYNPSDSNANADAKSHERADKHADKYPDADCNPYALALSGYCRKLGGRIHSTL